MEKISKAKIDNYLSAVEAKRRQGVLNNFLQHYILVGLDIKNRLDAGEEISVELIETVTYNIDLLTNYQLQ